MHKKGKSIETIFFLAVPQNNYTIWGKARAALLSHFQKPNTAAIWEETHSAAILNISCTDPAEYTRQAVEAVQR